MRALPNPGRSHGPITGIDEALVAGALITEFSVYQEHDPVAGVDAWAHIIIRWNSAGSHDEWS